MTKLSSRRHFTLKSAMKFSDAPSPNHGPRRDSPTDILIIHYTGMRSGAAALERLCDPAAGVSCHWLIEEDGRIFKLVAESERACHAGVSYWDGATDINSRSIGIELVNPGHEWGYRHFPERQMNALAQLATEIVARHPIPPYRVLGHSDVAPTRKQDPGELFDWRWLAGHGIGLWPPTEEIWRNLEEAHDLETALAVIGYDPDVSQRELVAAFQRHWSPHRTDGVLDTATICRLAVVARAVAVLSKRSID